VGLAMNVSMTCYLARPVRLEQKLREANYSFY